MDAKNNKKRKISQILQIQKDEQAGQPRQTKKGVKKMKYNERSKDEEFEVPKSVSKANPLSTSFAVSRSSFAQPQNQKTTASSNRYAESGYSDDFLKIPNIPAATIGRGSRLGSK